MLYILTNAEYLAFMNSAVLLTEAEDEGVPELGLSPELIGSFKKDLALLADVVRESRISQETEEASLREKNRGKLVTYITRRISLARRMLHETERDAGNFLYKVIKPYIGTARLPMAQETAAIQGLLIDLRKEENAPYMTALGLDAYLDELEKENNAYLDLSMARTQSRAANKKESGAEIRKRLDVLYDDLVMLAQSSHVLHPSEKSNAFINSLNQLITETITAYNQRSKAFQKKEENNTLTAE